ncbi:hypothetical protein DL766_001146 [Monosporascus sp. MC13-8B]|nr:hypothetical protein DL766_001146 [Monosporascus sp. MC13-8B]
MDAFLSKLSHHATSYAIRSCLALTSKYLVEHGSKLLKAVDDGPLHAQLSLLQRRLARKIELISPILETIEFHYTRGNSTLEAVVRTARELRDDTDALARRLEATATAVQIPQPGVRAKSSVDAAARRAELLAIIDDIKELILRIDDCLPSINLWVSAMGGIQAQQSAFSPSRLLQASYLVNVGDTQYILNPSQPMQIGPDFTLSLYMLFRGHASSHESEEPYGIEEGQRKPMWQEVIHKARVRLCRVPINSPHLSNGVDMDIYSMGYAYELQIVEDLDDGRVHTLDDGDAHPTPYDGIALAGIRESIPIGQVAKMLYADVGRILNINNEDGASSNPVLLLKRDVQATPPGTLERHLESIGPLHEHSNLVEGATDQSALSDGILSEPSPQDDIDRQLREESRAVKFAQEPLAAVSIPSQSKSAPACQWRLPQDLDPEWIALEVFDFGGENASDEEDDEQTTDDEDGTRQDRYLRPRHTSRPSVDSNLVTQLHRMSVASSSGPSSRPSSRNSFAPNHNNHTTELSLHRTHSSHSHSHTHAHPPTAESSSRLIARSPFGAIRTSLSLLEMLLRLASLQEFEQTTHLSIPDHVLRFYLDESASTTGLHGRERLAARAEAERKVGFDPYVDSPDRGGAGRG